MLKGALFSAALIIASPLAVAAESTRLAVGSVRDPGGSVIEGAQVRAFDAHGGVVGIGQTDHDGTFAVVLSTQASLLEVSCRHCQTVRIPVASPAPLAVIVKRFTALENAGPDAGDFAALPYQRIADAIGLRPYAIPAPDGMQISDRGLNRGEGLILDEGAPLYDISTGMSGLVDFPGRYARQVTLIDPSRAFQYGSYAGGGTFAIDRLVPQSSFFSGDAGLANSLTLEPSLGGLFPGLGVSSDGLLQRRADLDFEGPFAGGALRVGTSLAYSFQPQTSGDSARDLNLAHIDYATASRNYRTFVDIDTTSTHDFIGPENASTDYRASYSSAAFRLERPGPVTLAAGSVIAGQSGNWTAAGPQGFSTYGHVTNETAYVEAQSDGDRGGWFAGLGFAHETVTQDLQYGPFSGGQSLLLPSLQGHLALGGGFGLRAGVSTSLRVPTLLENYFSGQPPGSLVVERGKLQEGALTYDPGGRVRAEAIVFREDLRNVDDRRLLGVGASLVWQIAPNLSLRAWSLRDSSFDFQPASALPADVPLSRQVVWASYDIDGGVRIDAIAHRDVNAAQVTELDGDVVVPLGRGIGLDLGTFRRVDGRRFSIGLRFR